MHLESCSRDLGMDKINPYWCLQCEHHILFEEKSVNISPYDYPVASISQPRRFFEVLVMVLAKIRDLYGIPLIGYVRDEPFVLPSDDHPEYNNCPDAEMKARVMIYDQEDPKTDKVAKRDDQIVISRSATLTLVATAAMPLVWEVLFHFFGNTPLWVHVRCTNADKNGRLAYFFLRHHMMGPGYLTAQSTHIEETANSVVNKQGDKGLQVFINALAACWAQVDDNVILGENNPYDEKKRVNIILTAV